MVLILLLAEARKIQSELLTLVLMEVKTGIASFCPDSFGVLCWEHGNNRYVALVKSADWAVTRSQAALDCRRQARAKLQHLSRPLVVSTGRWGER